MQCGRPNRACLPASLPRSLPPRVPPQWGFDCMGMAVDLAYLRYASARLSAYRNVWWSLANEWSQMACKCGPGGGPGNCSQAYWDALFAELQRVDPHGRQRSIHNDKDYYNHSQPWVGHVSMQCAGAACVDVVVANWTSKTPKPIISDENGYEGNLTGVHWGNNTAEALVQRAWVFLAKGAHAGHSETLLPASDTAACANPAACNCSVNMWWNHGGGPLLGQSPAALGWLRAFVDAMPVPFAELASVDLAPGVYWLRSADRAYGVVVFDERVLATPTKATVPLPAQPGGPPGWYVRAVDIMARTVTQLGTAPPGDFTFTPPTPGFVLEFAPFSSGLGAAPSHEPLDYSSAGRTNKLIQ